MKVDRLGQIIASAEATGDQRMADGFEALSEGERIEIVKAAGELPVGCSPVPVGPARGACRAFTPMDAYPKGERDWEWKPSGHAGRRALKMMDVFDVMSAQAMRKKRPAPFTQSQISMARTYRALVERHASAGVKCSSVEGRVGGSGQGGEFMDAVLRDRERIDLIRKRIGPGVAMEVRRVRPSDRADGKVRQSISDRSLVDLVCIEDMSLDDVLDAFGWAIKGSHRSALRGGLAGALDRMAGPGRRRDILCVRVM